MILAPLAGLANRLRAMMSRYEPGLKVQWAKSWEVADAHFLDVFEPLPGVEFVSYGVPDEQTWDAANTGGDVSWYANYRLLRPLPELQVRIMRVQDELGLGYRAVHMRRTDHVVLAERDGHFTSDHEFIEWCNSDFDPIFVATDNAETRRVMSNAIGGRAHYQGPMRESHATQHHTTRHNSLADAVVDLYVCVGARDFMGSAHSSFSELITHMRGLR